MPISDDKDNTSSAMALTAGMLISHYRIIEKIGAGGMGEVYLAEDSNLNRRVAIKVLPDLYGSDPERLARLEREAKLLASLDHTNLATIHDFESVAGKPFLVMEFVAGETLAQRIDRGPLPIDETLEVCRQIADGMEAAHEKGVIHRDLKPANIRITPEGKVKILDFGLAKALREEPVAVDTANSPTITDNLTHAGVILGTGAYMSPEQAKGKLVDKRTDIWAFGCILFECLTGKRAFEGETTSEILAEILRGEPNWDSLPVHTPAHVRDLLHRCLCKDVARRLHDIGDARLEVEHPSFDTFPTPAARSRSKRERIAWAVAVIGAVAAALLWISDGGRQAAKPEPTISSILPPENSVNCFRDGFALSPDGRSIAFVSLSSKGERLVWMRFLDRREAVPLAGTDGAGYPFWSPDSRDIAFYAGGYLKRVAATGGPVQSICRASQYGRWGGSWGTAGVILFSDLFEGVSRVSEAGGEPVRMLTEGTMTYPCFLPDGQSFLYIRHGGTEPAVVVATLAQPDSGRVLAGISDAGRVEWVAPDLILVWRRSDRSLFTQGVDLSSGRIAEPHQLLAERVPSPGDWPLFSASRNYVAAFVVFPPEAANSLASRMVWMDREGNIIGRLGDVGGYWNVRISPDGRRVAVNPDDDIWLFDAMSGPPTRFTNEMTSGSVAYRPLWSGSGDRILARTSDRTNNVLSEYSIAGGQPRAIWKDSNSYWNATDWSRNGQYVAIDRNLGLGNLSDLVYFDFVGNELRSFIATPFDECAGQFSPDGHWIAYASNETGSYEIYIRSFPDGGQFRRVSRAGGMHPRWRADGRELFFLGPDWTVMVAEVKLQPSLEIEPPKPLFQTVMADVMKGQIAPYDVAPDGQRFLVISPQAEPIPLTLVQNWQALVDRR